MLRSFFAAAMIGAFAFAAVPARAQDAAEMVVRIGQLENQMRQMAGQIEQLQYENKRLTEQMRKFQEDVDFRFQEKSGGGRGPSANPGPQRRSDAFDPSTSPAAPGAPLPLGSSQSAAATLPPAGPAQTASINPSTPRANIPQGALPTGGVSIIDDTQGNAAPARAGTSVAAANPGDPVSDYEGAYNAVLNRQYDQAEMGFRRFLQSHPRDRRAGDATYWLGESYFQRQRYREAAEQFLKVTTDFPKAGKAPDSLLKLGMSLKGIGAKEQACATYAEIGRRFPAASVEVKQAAERERKRTKC
jgi:tol-pal system protein YbgF